MTPAEIAQKIVSNPYGYTEDSVLVAAALINALDEIKRMKSQFNHLANLAAYHATKRIEAELSA